MRIIHPWIKTVVRAVYQPLLFFCLAQPIMAMQMPPPKDPYQSIRYTNAFEQNDLYREYQNLMIHLGCVANVLPDFQPIVEDDEKSDDSYIRLEEGGDDAGCNLRKFEAACLKKLNRARKMALSEPAIYALTEMSMMGGGAAVAIFALGSKSMGGSFAVFAAIFDSLRLVKGTIQSGHHLISPPSNQMKDLEEGFAKNKCFIPRVLWPKITNAFVAARQNEFSRESHMGFIEFALGFTLYKPRQPLSFKDDLSLQDIKTEINRRIDAFFADYDTKECAQSLMKMKINIDKFIDSLMSNRRQLSSAKLPRYLYLHGPGGIGKTHFVQTLSGWIQELIPGSVSCEDLVITSADELEGSAQKAGSFLNVLRNQLIQNKHSSIVMIDEATWFNSPEMVSPAKRAFNGNLGKLSTSYFGKGIDGSHIKLDIPPMLIFVASNTNIEDSALQSRFDVLEYPKPTKEALIKYAQVCANQSSFLENKNYDEKIKHWVNELIEENQNFRYISANIEVALSID